MSRRRILISLACLAGLGWNFWLWKPFFPYIFARANNDFVCTYTGAVLAGNSGLYDVGTVTRTQLALADSPQFMMYQRFPFYAAMVSPLRSLTYLRAFRVWQSLSLAALLLFLWFWPGQRRWIAAIACCWSLPLANCFIMGQDVTLVMAALALSMALFFRGHHFAAGCLMALCSIKFHLFLTLPLFILTRRLWRFGAGTATGGAALLAASFAVQGRHWPADYLHMLRLPTSTPSYSLMPNLNGLLSGQPHGPLLTTGAAALIVMASVLVMRRGKPTVAVSAMLVSGLLLSYHAFIADAVLLIPAGLLLLRDRASLAHRATGMVVLSPIAFLGFRLQNPPFPPATTVLVPVAVMAACAIHASLRNLRSPRCHDIVPT